MEKDSMESKKLALLRILEILQRYSDEDHHLKQEDIIAYLERDYAIAIERKAVSRNISLLKESGAEIESDKKGSWLAKRTFTNTELRILIDSILASRFISEERSKELISKLCSQTSIYFKSNIKHIHSVNEWNKTDNPTLFANIETVCDAIERHKPILITQLLYGIDKEPHEAYSITVTPVAVFIVEQEYMILYVWDMSQNGLSDEPYPVVFTAELRNLGRIEICENETAIDIESIEVLRQKNIPLYLRDNAIGKKGAAYSEESGRLQRFTFVCKQSDIDTVLDRFGKDARITKLPEFDKELFGPDDLWEIARLYKGMIKVSVRTTKIAVMAFVISLWPYAFILSPEDVKNEYRDKLKAEINAMEVITDELEKLSKKKNKR